MGTFLAKSQIKCHSLLWSSSTCHSLWCPVSLVMLKGTTENTSAHEKTELQAVSVKWNCPNQFIHYVLINMFYPVIHQNKTFLKLGIARGFLSTGCLWSNSCGGWSPVGDRCLRPLWPAGNSSNGFCRRGRRLCSLTRHTAVILEPVQPSHVTSERTETQRASTCLFKCTYFNYPYHEVPVCQNSVPPAKNYEAIVYLLCCTIIPFNQV